MKTTVLFRMMVLVAMVVAGIANTELKAQDNNFITNEEKSCCFEGDLQTGWFSLSSHEI